MAEKKIVTINDLRTAMEPLSKGADIKAHYAETNKKYRVTLIDDFMAADYKVIELNTDFDESHEEHGRDAYTCGQVLDGLSQFDGTLGLTLWFDGDRIEITSLSVKDGVLILN